MTRTQFASTIAPPAPTVAKISGNLTSSQTYSVWLACRNRAGMTEYSDYAEISIEPGEGIQITIPAAVKASASTFLFVAVILGTDTNPATGSIVATVDFEETFPFTLNLDRPDLVAINATVQTEADLDALDTIQGMRRYINDQAQFREYNAIEDSWDLFSPQTFNPFVPSSTGVDGADISLLELSDLNNIIFPSYSVDGEPSEEVLFWIVNNTSAPIPQGTRVRMAAFSASTRDFQGTDYEGLLEVEFLGYVDTATAELDTADLDVGGYIPYLELNLHTLVLPRDLPPGFAYILGVRANFSAFELANTILQGETIFLYPYFAPYRSVYNPVAKFLGDHILSIGNRRRVVPRGPGLNLRALSGTGTVKQFEFENAPEMDVFPLAANTANQNVVITNNGTCYISAIIPVTAVLRAVVGTVDGAGMATPVMGIALDTSLRLRITLTNPTTIRLDYPDSSAGMDALLNADTVRVYAFLGSAGQYWDVPISGEPTETIIVGDSPGTPISSVAEPQADFGLFEPQVETATQAGSSTFTPGAYQVQVAYLYQNTVTKVNHQAPGAINENLVPYGDLLQLVSSSAASGIRFDEFNDLLDLTPETGLNPLTLYFVGRDQYSYDPNENQYDDLTTFPLSGPSPGAIVRNNLPVLLSGNLIWHVSPLGDSTSPGLSPSERTTWEAVANRLSKIDLNGKTLTVDFEADQGFLNRIVLPAIRSRGNLILKGDETDYPILALGIEAVAIACSLRITDFDCQGSILDALSIEDCPDVAINNIRYGGGSSNNAIGIKNSKGSFSGNIEFVAGARVALLLDQGSIFEATTADFSIAGNQTFSGQAFEVTNNSLIDLGNKTVSGDFFGRRYLLDRGFIRASQPLDGGVFVSGGQGQILNDPALLLNKQTLTASRSFTIAAGATVQLNSINLNRTRYVVTKVSSNQPIRVRGYADPAKQVADEERPPTTFPTGDHGLVFDVEPDFVSEDNYSINLNPPAIGLKTDNPQTDILPLSLTSTAGTTGATTVSLDVEFF